MAIHAVITPPLASLPFFFLLTILYIMVLAQNPAGYSKGTLLVRYVLVLVVPPLLVYMPSALSSLRVCHIEAGMQ